MFKKIISIHLFIMFLLVIGSCDDPYKNGIKTAKTGKVTFFNESSYKIKIHRDSFSGPVLLELPAGKSKQIDVRVSDAHGLGTTFPIEYLYKVTENFDTQNGEIFASGLDFNVQLVRVIEEKKSYTIQIPQPKNLAFRNAFIKLLNSDSLPIQLNYFGQIIQQAGTGIYPIAPSKTGIYRIDGIPDQGQIFNGYNVVSNFITKPIPEFTAKNGFIYSYTYNGTAVTPDKNWEQTIIFK